MKKIVCGVTFFLSLFFIPRVSHAQQPAAYQVPETYTFDYVVVQEVKDDKKNSGPTLLDYYYTQNGDYMCIRPEKDKKGFMIFTKDGVSVIIDDEKKTIVVMRLGNLIGDIGKAFADPKKNNPSASKSDSSGGKTVKTGNTKQISGYTAEEYKFTNNKGEVSTVWCAKVDFSASIFYMLGNMGFGGGAPGRPGMNRPSSAAQSYPSFTDPQLLLAETHSADHPGQGLTTQSITKKTTTISTKGYTINNMSNMGLKDIMEKAMQNNQ
jgi:hypothetical protein